MPKYRVCDPDGDPIDDAELADSTTAYDWFKSVAVPDDALGYRLEVDSDGDGDWRLLDTADGGTNPHPGADG